MQFFNAEAGKPSTLFMKTQLGPTSGGKAKQILIYKKVDAVIEKTTIKYEINDVTMSCLRTINYPTFNLKLVLNTL